MRLSHVCHFSRCSEAQPKRELVIQALDSAGHGAEPRSAADARNVAPGPHPIAVYAVTQNGKHTNAAAATASGLAAFTSGTFRLVSSFGVFFCFPRNLQHLSLLFFPPRRSKQSSPNSGGSGLQLPSGFGESPAFVRASGRGRPTSGQAVQDGRRRGIGACRPATRDRCCHATKP